MTGSELPACSLDDWQADMLSQMATIRSQLADMQQQQTRIETQAIRTNGRVSGLEDRMEVADRERSTLSAQVAEIRSNAVDEIKQALRAVVGEELDRRQTEADAAAFKALKRELGDPVAKMKQINRIERFLMSTASKIWVLVVTAVTLAIIAMVADRLF